MGTKRSTEKAAARKKRRRRVSRPKRRSALPRMTEPGLAGQDHGREVGPKLYMRDDDEGAEPTPAEAPPSEPATEPPPAEAPADDEPPATDEPPAEAPAGAPALPHNEEQASAAS